jgi:hypothetical protein
MTRFALVVCAMFFFSPAHAQDDARSLPAQFPPSWRPALPPGWTHPPHSDPIPPGGRLLGQGWERWGRTQRPSSNIEDFRNPPDADWVLVFHKPTGEEVLLPRGPAYDGNVHKTGRECLAAGRKAIKAYPDLVFRCGDLGFLRHLFDKRP